MTKELIFHSENSEVQYLCTKDARFAQLVEIIGEILIPLRSDPFDSLVRSIIGQQLSVKVANTLYMRLEELCKPITPASILNAPDDELRTIGLSKPKISYLKNLSEKVVSEEIPFHHLPHFGNDTVISLLSSVKGIGKWTAEMFLIFTMGRMDVLPLADVGLQRSAKWLYHADKNIDGEKCLKDASRQWKPYYTIASVYLWEAVNQGFVDSFASLEELLDRA